MSYILAFGDSIIYGAWDKKGGWLQRLREDIDKKNLEWKEDFYYLVYNLGISGDTSENLLKRFENEVKERKTEEEFIFIFAIGTNDSQYVHSKKALNIFEAQFKTNLQKLIKKAKKYSSKIFFVGLTLVDEKKVTPMPWAPDKSYLNKNLKKYDQIVKNVCQENKVHFIEIFDKVKQQNYYQLLSQDGAHPNSKGHEFIYKLAKKYLNKHLFENKL